MTQKKLIIVTDMNVLDLHINLISAPNGCTVKCCASYYGTKKAIEDGIDIKNEDIPSKVAIVIGNEGRGISEVVRKYCKKNIYINMNDKCESLNAGVSASIIMYEVMNK